MARRNEMTNKEAIQKIYEFNAQYVEEAKKNNFQNFDGELSCALGRAVMVLQGIDKVLAYIEKYREEAQYDESGYYSGVTTFDLIKSVIEEEC